MYNKPRRGSDIPAISSSSAPLTQAPLEELCAAQLSPSLGPFLGRGCRDHVRGLDGENAVFEVPFSFPFLHIPLRHYATPSEGTGTLSILNVLCHHSCQGLRSSEGTGPFVHTLCTDRPG